MKFVFANSGGFGPPKQLQRALHQNPGADYVLFSYYYLRQWDPTWIVKYIETGDPIQDDK